MVAHDRWLPALFTDPVDRAFGAPAPRLAARLGQAEPNQRAHRARVRGRSVDSHPGPGRDRGLAHARAAQHGHRSPLVRAARLILEWSRRGPNLVASSM